MNAFWTEYFSQVGCAPVFSTARRRKQRLSLRRGLLVVSQLQLTVWRQAPTARRREMALLIALGDWYLRGVDAVLDSDECAVAVAFLLGFGLGVLLTI